MMSSSISNCSMSKCVGENARSGVLFACEEKSSSSEQAAAKVLEHPVLKRTSIFQRGFFYTKEEAESDCKEFAPGRAIDPELFEAHWSEVNRQLDKELASVFILPDDDAIAEDTTLISRIRAYIKGGCRTMRKVSKKAIFESLKNSYDKATIYIVDKAVEGCFHAINAADRSYQWYKEFDPANSTSDFLMTARNTILENTKPGDSILTQAIHKLRGIGFREDLSDTDRVYLERFDMCCDILDLITVVVSAEDHVIAMILRNFVGRYMDSKDTKYSHMVGLLWTATNGIRDKLGGKDRHFRLVCELVARHNLTYKTNYGIFDGDNSHIVTQSVVDDAKELLNGALGSELLQTMYKLIMACLSLRLFKNVVPDIFFKYFKVPVKVSNPLELLDFSLNTLSSLERYFNSWLSGTPLKDIVFSPDPLVALENKIRTLKVQKDYLYSGLPMDGYRDIKEFAVELKETIDTIPLVLKNLSPFRNRSTDLRNELIVLSALLSDVNGRIAGECRITPFAINFASKPGTGKSSVLRLSAAVFSEVRGRTYDDSLIYPRSRTSKYWEGYNPLTNPYVFYAEMGTMSEKMAENIVDERLIEMTAVIDNLTMYPDMAFEGKGKTKLYCELVLIDTNKADLNLPKQVNNPSAFLRRWITVECIVKPEYRKGEGPSAYMLDYAKCDDGAAPMDRWWFRVIRHEPIDAQRTRVVVLLDGQDEESNVHAYCDLLRKLFKEHLAKEEDLNKVRKNIDTRDYSNNDLPFAQGDFDDGGNEYDIAARVNHGEADDPLVIPMVEVHNNYKWLVDLYEKGSRAAWVVKNVCDSLLVCLVNLFLTLAGVHDKQAHALCFIAAYAYISQYLASFYWSWGIYSVYAFFKVVDFLMLYTCYLSTYRVDMGAGVTVSIVKVRNSFLKLSRFFSKKDQPDDIAPKPVNYFTWVFAALALITSGASAYGAYNRVMAPDNKVFKKNMPVPHGDTRAQVDGKGKVSVSEVKRVEEIEEKVAAGLRLSRLKNVLTDSYNVWDRKFVLSNSTQKIAEFAQRCMTNSVYISVHTKVVNRAFMLGISGQYAITNKHLFAGNQEGFVRVYASYARDDDRYQEFKFTSKDLVDVSNDIVMIRVPVRTFKDLKGALNGGTCVDFSDGYVAMTPTTFTTASTIIYDKHVGKIELKKAVTYQWSDNKGGFCGLPLTCRVGNCDYLIGIHGAAAEPSDHCFGPVFEREEILKSLAIMSERYASFFPPSSHADLTIELGEPIPKSPLFYLDLRALEYYGKMPGPVPMNKSSDLIPSPISDEVDVIFAKHFPKEVFNEYAPPIMKPVEFKGQYINPYNVFLEKVAINKKSFPLTNFSTIVDTLVNRFVQFIPKEQHGNWAPLTAHQALNGIPEDVYVRKVDLSTAGGFGYPGAKRPYTVGEQPSAEFSPQLRTDVASLITTLSNGDFVPTFFEAQLKDEARSLEKVLKGKTRVFCTSSFPSLVVQRMFLGPMFSSLVEIGHNFGISIGVNMHTQAESRRNKMIAFSDKWMEGDYSGYDLAMPVELAMASASVIYKVCEKMGYNPEALRALSGVLTDQIFPHVVVNKDVFVIPGYQPSGKYGTAEDNSLRGLILLMAYWATQHKADTFFDNCCPLIYGDDVLVAVKPKHARFMNNVNYAKFIEENTSMQYTSAAKDGKLTEFVAPDKASFLKRVWKKRKWFDNHYVAPLAVDSLKRSLNWILPSKTETLGNQVVSTVISVLRELLFHLPPTEVDGIRSELSRAVAKHFNVHSDFVLSKIPSPHDMLASLLAHQEWSDITPVEYVGESACRSDFLTNVFDLFRIEAFAQGDSEDKSDFDDVPLISEFEESAREHARKLDFFLSASKTIMDVDTARIMKESEAYFAVPAVRDEVDAALTIHAEIAALTQTVRILRMAIRKASLPPAVTQSLSEVVPQESVIEEKHVTLTDVDGEKPSVNSVMRLSNVHIFRDSKEDLDSFFSRPQLLATANITSSSTRFFHKVWDLYFSNPTVRAKLRNYSMIRANLHLKITLTGTPYHKGSLLVSYIPLQTTNAVYNMYTANAYGNNFSKWLSQVPGAMKLDIRLNKPYEMTVPFIAPNAAARLYNASTSALPDVTSFDDISSLGELVIGVLNGISATGGATDPYYYLYGWLEDVELGPPTATVMAITTQGDSDERKTGPVERYSAAASQVAMALTQVPVIAPFARASAIALGAMTRISSLFGWSMPVMTTQPMRARVEPFQNSANLIGYDTGHRITMDPKQELTVDPRICGSDTDDMAIATIARRESLLDLQSWSYSSSPMSPIWRAFVMPEMNRRFVNVAKNYVQPTSLHYSAIPFQAWRGDITFVFTFYPTSFHRGKIAVLYEPNCDQFSLISAGISLNKNYLAIVDLQTTTEVSVCVKWAQPRYYQQCAPESISQNSISSAASATVMRDYANGWIALVPITNLVGPAGYAVDYAVTVYSDNIEYAYPDQSLLPTLVTQSDSTTQLDGPCIDLVDIGSDGVRASQLHYGERVFSFRALLKRFTQTDRKVLTVAAVNPGDYVLYRSQIVPVLTPSVSGGAADPTSTSLLSFLRPSYLGMRGGFRKRVRIIGHSPAVMAVISVQLDTPDVATIPTFTQVGTSNISGIRGATQFVPYTNSGIEFEIPCYTNNLFGVPSRADIYDPAVSSMFLPRALRTYSVYMDCTSAATYVASEMTATAEDFTLMNYIAATPYSYTQ